MIVFEFVFKLCSLRVNTLYQSVQTSRDELREFESVPILPVSESERKGGGQN